MNVLELLREGNSGGGMRVFAPQSSANYAGIARTVTHALRFLQTAPESVDRERCGEQLTLREIQVLKLVALGGSNQEIAEDLSTSKRTVETHVRHIYAKLAIERRSQAVLYAVRHGLV